MLRGLGFDSCCLQSFAWKPAFLICGVLRKINEWRKMAIAVLLKIASSGVKQLPSRATACVNVAQRVFSFAIWGGGGARGGQVWGFKLHSTVYATHSMYVAHSSFGRQLWWAFVCRSCSQLKSCDSYQFAATCVISYSENDPIRNSDRNCTNRVVMLFFRASFQNVEVKV